MQNFCFNFSVFSRKKIMNHSHAWKNEWMILFFWPSHPSLTWDNYLYVDFDATFPINEAQMCFLSFILVGLPPLNIYSFWWLTFLQGRTWLVDCFLMQNFCFLALDRKKLPWCVKICKLQRSDMVAWNLKHTFKESWPIINIFCISYWKISN